ncbi:hypothetical protein ABZ297_43200 [Nonomuraea sp. NPDC005983]|uniref:hypothetical protein n=1 Tax=Nonomuraea sp. NPDC005983 TaxID=3155595 RepID=UPI0033A483C4
MLKARLHRIAISGQWGAGLAPRVADVSQLSWAFGGQQDGPRVSTQFGEEVFTACDSNGTARTRPEVFLTREEWTMMGSG